MRAMDESIPQPDLDDIMQYVDTAAKKCAPCAILAASYLGGRSRDGSSAATVRELQSNSQKALHGVTTSTSECAEDVKHAIGTPCASKKMTRTIIEFVTTQHPSGRAQAAPRHELLPSAPTAESVAVRDAAGILKCKSESCVVAHPVLRKFAVKRKLMTVEDLDIELELRYKESGPRDNLDLLSNFDIDGTMRRWARVFPDLYPCPFAMMDFDRNGNAFGRVRLDDMLNGRESVDLGPGIGRVYRKFRCFGCVVNTDTSSGPGKHWVAVFVDCRGGPGEMWSVEYFNSAGNPPPKQMVVWMERSRDALTRYRADAGPVKSISVTDMDHQESQTECGIYALYYIRRRIEGKPHTFFLEQLIPDDAMTTFRTHIFRRAK
jgi:hypothetical protein